MIGWIVKGILGLGSSVSDAYQANQESKSERVKAKAKQQIAEIEGKTKVTMAKIDADVAEQNARAKAAERIENHTQDYDMRVLKNRDKTYADEFIIIVWFFVFLAHFITWTQPNMAAGWAAMGYKDGPAWWFEFGMVGILVSTLGLMRVLRLFVGNIRQKFGKAKTDDKS